MGSKDELNSLLEKLSHRQMGKMGKISHRHMGQIFVFKNMTSENAGYSLRKDRWEAKIVEQEVLSLR